MADPEAEGDAMLWLKHLSKWNYYLPLDWLKVLIVRAFP
jgi:hypothetical protein